VSHLDEFAVCSIDRYNSVATMVDREFEMYINPNPLLTIMLLRCDI